VLISHHPLAKFLLLLLPKIGCFEPRRLGYIAARSYFLPLQRAITDFGADVHLVASEIMRTSCISVPISSAQVHPKSCCFCVHQTQLLHTEIPTIAGVEQLVVKWMGTLIPSKP